MTINGAYLLPGATLLRGEDSGFFEIYKGIIETNSGKENAYVKLLPKKALANELLCTTLGQAINLPIPDGYLVQVSITDYPESAFLTSQKLPHTLAFGSAALQAPSLARQFGSDDFSAFKALLEAWPHWNSALLFDEWISNSDRHSGNFLVNGPTDIWLIDHSHAFRGPNWYISDLIPTASSKNLIAAHASQNLTLPERARLIQTADQISADYKLLDIDKLIETSKAPLLLSTSDVNAIRSFLLARTNSLPQLIAKHMGIPRFSA